MIPVEAQKGGEFPLHKELQTAKAAALEAGKIIRQGFGKVHKTWTKADNSLASAIDDAAEARIQEILTETFPDHAFWGEEGGRSSQKSPNLWIVDGLDGSHNFLAGIQDCAVSIAHIKDGELVIGVIYNPFRDELFWAERERGSFLNSKPIRVSVESVFSHATVGFTRGSIKEDKALLGKIYNAVGQEVRNTRILGSSALHFAYVASGRFDALVNIGNHPWDFAAGILLIREAGGRVTDLEGNDLNLETNRIIASNGVSTIHASLLGIAKTQALL